MNYLKNMGPLPKGEARRYGGERDPKCLDPIIRTRIRSTHIEDILKIGFSLVSEGAD